MDLRGALPSCTVTTAHVNTVRVKCAAESPGKDKHSLGRCSELLRRRLDLGAYGLGSREQSVCRRNAEDLGVQRGQKSNTYMVTSAWGNNFSLCRSNKVLRSTTRLAQDINSGCPLGAEESQYVFTSATHPLPLPTTPPNRECQEEAGPGLRCSQSPGAWCKALRKHLRSERTNKCEHCGISILFTQTNIRAHSPWS